MNPTSNYEGDRFILRLLPISGNEATPESWLDEEFQQLSLDLYRKFLGKWTQTHTMNQWSSIAIHKTPNAEDIGIALFAARPFERPEPLKRCQNKGTFGNGTLRLLAFEIENVWVLWPFFFANCWFVSWYVFLLGSNELQGGKVFFHGSFVPGTWLVAMTTARDDTAAVNGAAQAALVAEQWQQCLEVGEQAASGKSWEICGQSWHQSWRDGFFSVLKKHTHFLAWDEHRHLGRMFYLIFFARIIFQDDKMKFTTSIITLPRIVAQRKGGMSNILRQGTFPNRG